MRARRGEGSAHERGKVDDATLVARAATGDGAAFEALYRRHHGPLFRTALAMTRRSQVAEEVLQETFLRAYRHMGRVRLAEGASLRPWLHRILIRLVYDWTARRSAREGREATARPPLAALAPERQVERNEVDRLVSAAVDTLPFKQRIVVVLFYVHDMDLDEIAATLDVPPGTVKSRLFYGRARLRAQLTEDVRLPRGIAVRELAG